MKKHFTLLNYSLPAPTVNFYEGKLLVHNEFGKWCLRHHLEEGLAYNPPNSPNLLSKPEVNVCNKWEGKCMVWCACIWSFWKNEKISCNSNENIYPFGAPFEMKYQPKRLKSSRTYFFMLWNIFQGWELRISNLRK